MLASAPLSTSRSRPGDRRRVGTGMLILPERYLPVSEFGLASISASTPSARTLPPNSPAPGPEIEKMIGGTEHVWIVLDDNDGVAKVAQVFEDVNQAIGVARVQADRGFVEDVERTDQPRPERSRKLDPLRFAAGECRGKPIEGQVFEAHGVKKREALADLLEDRAGNLLLHRREVESREEVFRFGDGERRGLADVEAIDPYGPGFGAETLATAIGTLGVATIFAEHHAHVKLVLLALHLREEAVHSDEASLPAQHDFSDIVGKLAPGLVEGNTQLGSLLLQIRKPGAILWAVPGIDCAVIQAQALVRNDKVQVVVDCVAEALAARAGTKGVVETKEAWFGLAAGAMAAGATILA